MSDSKKWLLLVLFVVFFLLFYLLASILTSFLFASLLAYLGDPVVDKLESYGTPRTGAVVLVFLSILLFVVLMPFILIPLLQQQLVELFAKLPRYIDWIQLHVAPVISEALNIDIEILNGEQLKKVIGKHWREFGNIASPIYTAVSQSGMMMLAWLVNLALVPVVTFYLLRDWDKLVENVHGLIPSKLEPTVVEITKQSDLVLGAFLRGQLTVMMALGTIYILGLWMLGLDLAFLIGLFAGVVSFVPYLGFIVGILLAGIAAFMQFGDFVHLIGVVAVFSVGQMIEGMVLTPLLVGDKIGLHPVAVIFAIMAGGQLFGFTGILLALPVAAVLMVLLRYAHDYYKQTEMYSA